MNEADLQEWRWDVIQKKRPLFQEARCGSLQGIPEWKSLFNAQKPSFNRKGQLTWQGLCCHQADFCDVQRWGSCSTPAFSRLQLS